MASSALVALGGIACALGARHGLSCALAEYFVVLPTDSHSWAFDGSISI